MKEVLVEDKGEDQKEIQELAAALRTVQLIQNKRRAKFPTYGTGDAAEGGQYLVANSILNALEVGQYGLKLVREKLSPYALLNIVRELGLNEPVVIYRDYVDEQRGH